MPELKLIFIIEEVRGKVRSVTVEVSRILRKDTQILIIRNGHDFETLATKLRSSDLPILESLRTYGLPVTPYEIPSEKLADYPFSVYLQITNQFYIRRKRFGGVKIAQATDLVKIPTRTSTAEIGVFEGCDFVSRIGVHTLSCDVYFRYLGCARRLPFLFSSVPLRNDDGGLFIRDQSQEKKIIQSFRASGVAISAEGKLSLTHEQFKALSGRLPEGVRFLTAKNQLVKSYSHSRTSSGLQWFGEVNEMASSDVVDAYLTGRRYVTVDDAVIIADRDELTAAARRAVENILDVSRETGNSLHCLVEDLHKLERVPNIVGESTWDPDTTVLRADLKPYQVDGVRWIRALKVLGLGGILADEMGLGKTVQLLGACAKDILQSNSPSLIIAPASVVENWCKEIEKFTPLLAERIDLNLKKISAGRLYILSYERARINADRLRKLSFSHLIVDEGQKIKNAETIAYQTLVGLVAEFKMVLTGTPIENNIQELWNHVGFIDPLTIGCLKELSRHYPSLDSIEKRNRMSLMMLSPFVLARKKRDVLRNMPTLDERVVYCQMGGRQRKVYETIRRSFLVALKRGRSVAVPSLALEALLRLRECCCHPLILPVELNSRNIGDSAKFEWVRKFVEEIKQTHGKVLIFSQFVTVLERLKRQTEDQGVACYCLTGSTNRRQSLIDAFNSDTRTSVFLCSIKAGGFGINLTSANNVVLMDPWWNPAVEQQAYARAHRIGQRHNVAVFKLICKDTVEEKVLQLQEQKRKLAEGLGVGKLKVSEMVEILRSE